MASAISSATTASRMSTTTFASAAAEKKIRTKAIAVRMPQIRRRTTEVRCLQSMDASAYRIRHARALPARVCAERDRSEGDRSGDAGDDEGVADSGGGGGGDAGLRDGAGGADDAVAAGG